LSLRLNGRLDQFIEAVAAENLDRGIAQEVARRLAEGAAAEGKATRVPPT
jgi:hypothetical protein